MNKSKINKIWKEIYGENQINLFDDFLVELDDFKKNNPIKNSAEYWYKDVVVYSLYVDLFNNDFSGLEEKLDYISELGISCLWLLPILDSPMRDAGFDIRDYKKIREELLKAKNQSKVFEDFIGKAHSKGIKVIFDIAINHSSEEHDWFQKAKSSKDSTYRNYYIWSETKDKYSDARIIFKGMEDSNWKENGGEYFFHRFFDFQPDLNYRNPMVLIEMTI
jgi:maltose alpha-D-glucosyltransferase/alpha-amylase